MRLIETVIGQILFKSADGEGKARKSWTEIMHQGIKTRFSETKFDDKINDWLVCFINL